MRYAISLMGKLLLFAFFVIPVAYSYQAQHSETVTLDGNHLTITQLDLIARHNALVKIDDTALAQS